VFLSSLLLFYGLLSEINFMMMMMTMIRCVCNVDDAVEMEHRPRRCLSTALCTLSRLRCINNIELVNCFAENARLPK